jgi:hypothetical protein
MPARMWASTHGEGFCPAGYFDRSPLLQATASAAEKIDDWCTPAGRRCSADLCAESICSWAISGMKAKIASVRQESDVSINPIAPSVMTTLT